MFLAVLLVVLCLRVYTVVYPQDADEDTTPQFVDPRSSLPATWEPPDMPGPPPAPPLSGEFSSLVKRNPFSPWGALQETDPNADDGTGDISLVRIVPWRDGSYRAELKTATTRGMRYKEGEQFESYILQSIDPDSNTCEVYSEKEGRTITLRVED